MTRYISLAEYFWLAEQVTGLEAAVLVKAARVDLADSALHAPQAGFCDEVLVCSFGVPVLVPAVTIGK